jgi:hypothetical protein
MWRFTKSVSVIVACIVAVLLVIVSSTSSIGSKPTSGLPANILTEQSDAGTPGNGTVVVPPAEISTAVVPAKGPSGVVLRGIAPDFIGASSDSQSILTTAPLAHWYLGAQYSGSQYNAHSVSCHLTVPSGYDVNTEFYYVILSVWDDGYSYDQIGLANNLGQWVVVWSWTSPDVTQPDGCDYHHSNNAYTLSLNTEYVFSMTLGAGGQLDYFVKNTGGTTLWTLHQDVGDDSYSFVIASSFYYPYYGYGAGDDMLDFTDYLECWNMEQTIRSPAFNWEFLYTSADSSYVSTFSMFSTSDAVTVPEWADAYIGANGYVEIWSGLSKITDFSDSSAYSIGSSVRWEDNSVWLAWRGSSNQNLNVIKTPDMKNWGTKTILTSKSSPYGPSIIWTHEYGGAGYSHIVMAWVGTGSSNYINTIRSTDGVTWTNQWIGNSGSTFPKSDRSPSLAFDSNNNILYLAYKAVTSKNIIILKSTNDAVSWTKIATLSGASQLTRDAPAIAWAGTQLFYLAFGSDANPGYLNVMQSTNGITWTNQKALPDRIADNSALAIGLTCTRDGLSISWYDYATSMVSFRRSAGGDPRFWGEKFSLPFGSFYGASTMCGLPKLDRYITWTGGAGNNLNLMNVSWNRQNPRYGTVDGFVEGFEDSAAFAQDWTFLYGTSHNPTTSQQHRGAYSYMTTSDLEVIQHGLPSVGMTGRLEIWIYDPGPSSYAKVAIAASESYPDARMCSMGIMSDQSYPGEYVYRYSGSTYYDTGVARTQGWHCLQIVVDGTNTIGYVDGTQVFSVSWLANMNGLTIGDWWSDGHTANTVAFDDVSFSTTYA